MKKISNKILSLGLGMLCLASFTACIDETEPQSSTATQDQINKSSKAMEAAVWAMPAYAKTCDPDNGHYRFGYPAIMRMRDAMTGDLPVVYGGGYNWFATWSENHYLGKQYAVTGYVWSFYNAYLLQVNSAIRAINPTSANDEQLGMLACARAYRAWLYLDLGQMYEFRANDATSPITDTGNNVTGLTIPLVNDTITVEQSRHNPRATHEQLAAFIKADLDASLADISKLTLDSKTLPHLDVVYGLLARYYMWNEDYAHAEEAAANAIANSSTGIMTEAEGRSTTNGFNTLDDFMWGIQYTSEDDAVSTGIVNWASFIAPENTFGYAGTAAGAFPMIDASMYARMSDNDWRKKMFKAPEDSPLSGQERFIDAENAAGLPTYTSIKFRPGQGNVSQYTVGASVAVPLMRVEEMYFIEAEAQAQQGKLADARATLETIMKTRNPRYSAANFSDQSSLIEEIIFQKRVELYGEGLTFFDIKRLNMSVTRGYPGTNWDEDERYNTNGRPAWMNWVIVRNEENNNDGVDGWNNPDPSNKYPRWTGE